MEDKLTTDIRRTKSGRAYVYNDHTYVNTRFEKEFVKLIDAEAKKEGLKRSSMIREICKKYFMEKGKIENVYKYNY